VTDGRKASDPARAGATAPRVGHAAGADDLDRLVRWGRQRTPARALDIATGDGRAALALAAFTPTVVTTAATPSVLRATRQFIASHGVAGVHVLGADGRALPFRDESFGVVTCRLAAHRFPEPLPVLRQVARVLRRGGSFLLVDLLGEDDPEIAAFILEVEKARDPGHVRAFRPIEWTAFLRAAGLTVIDEAVIETVRVWDEWTAGMSPDGRAALDRVVGAAPPRCRAACQFNLDGDRIHAFTARMLLLRADKD
jgi:SAM-dependent methyltransferase